MDVPIKFAHGFLSDFCSAYHVQRLSLFGSVLTDRFHAESDVDILVEFLPGQVPNYITLMQMQHLLSEHLGRKVDLRTPNELSKYFRDEVLASALTEYAA